jgi:arylsulfatase A-like enzyme
MWYLLGAGVAISAPPPESRPPNIVLITADNLGYGDLHCYGNQDIQTPHLDRLATQGVRCLDFYTASPTCTASRAALLTGRYPAHNGLEHQLSSAENLGVGLRHSERLIPQFLKPRGYATACFGKWNIGFAPGSRPTERGFDTFLGHASGNIDYYSHVYAGRHDMYRGTEAAHVEGYSTDLFADAAAEFIHRHRARPLFVYLPFNAPHFPQARNKQPGQKVRWQAPDWAFEAYGVSPDTQDARQRYRAVVTAMDAGVGRIMKQLAEDHLSDETLLIFFSDNGAFMLPDRGLEVAMNRPLRDGGVTLWEGGIRVPCIVRWPGQIPPGSLCREMLLSCDFFAMALSAAGAPLPDDRMIDGRDPTATLSGKGPSPHEALFFRYKESLAMRQGHYKLIREGARKPWQLFDLAKDLGEQHDVAAEHPRVVEQMQAELNRFDDSTAQ